MVTFEYVVRESESEKQKTYLVGMLGPKGILPITLFRAVHSGDNLTRLVEECGGNLFFHGIYNRFSVGPKVNELARQAQVEDLLSRLNEMRFSKEQDAS